MPGDRFLKVRIGVTEYDLQAVNDARMNDEYLDAMDEESGSSIVGGMVHPILGKMLINNEIPQQAKVQSFFHECVHAMLDELGQGELYSDEDFVDSFSKQIYGLFKYNNLDKIFAYLEGNKNGRTK